MNNKKKFNILFITPWYPSDKNKINGIFVKEHANAVSLYSNVALIYNEGYKKDIKGIYTIVKDSKEENIRVIRFYHKKSCIPKKSYINLIISYIKIIKNLKKEGISFDLIHANVYTSGFIAFILFKIFKIPYILSEHYTGFYKGYVRYFEKIKAKIAFKYSKKILPVSNSLKNILLKYYKNEKKYEVVYNTINLKIFNDNITNSNSFNENYNQINIKYSNQNKNKIYMLFIGNLIKRKGLKNLIYALDKIRKYNTDKFILNVIGKGPEELNYKRIVKELNLENNIIFSGQKDKKTIVKYLKTSDFFVLPSFYETFGVVYIEAMSSGKPVIGTKYGGSKEIIKDFCGIVIDPYNIDELYEAIKYMIKNFKNYDKNKIKNYVKNNFSYEIIGNKIFNIYKKIIL